MLPLMDSWLPDELGTIVDRLRQNLPVALATSITVSLILAFWKRIFRYAGRVLGLSRPAPAPMQPALPEGEFARACALARARGGFTVRPGWRAAVVDAGVVQSELGPGRYGMRAVRKMAARSRLGKEARVVFWRDRDFPAVFFLDGLYAADHHPMQLKIAARLRVRGERLLNRSLEDIARPPEEVAAGLCERLLLPARRWAASLESSAPYRDRAAAAQWAGLAEGWIRTALEDTPFELVRVTDLKLFHPALDRLFREYGELALEQEAARKEIERNRVRGALEQAVRAGKLAELRDRRQYEDAVRALEQEKELREKALRLELEQAEFAALEARLATWRAKRDLLERAAGTLMPEGPQEADAARRVADTLRQSAVEAADSPFTAQEREQIRAVLRTCASHAAQPGEILAAVAGRAGIPQALFDPAAAIRGEQTLRVGDGWRMFDGERLWQVRLTRIGTRRHGFWRRRESPARAVFEIRTSPGNRRLEQEIPLDGPFRLKLGANELAGQYLSGAPGRITVRID